SVAGGRVANKPTAAARTIRAMKRKRVMVVPRSRWVSGECVRPEHSALRRRDTVSSPATMALLEGRALARSLYGVHARNGVGLHVKAGTITGLIGPNGAGKTTLFHCVSGLIPPEAGRVRFDGHDITGEPPHRITRRGLVRTFQIARGFPRLSVLENLMLYGPAQPGEALWESLGRPPPVPRRERPLPERAARAG